MEGTGNQNQNSQDCFKVIPKEELKIFLERLNKEYKLILPTHKNKDKSKEKTKNNELIFDYVDVLNEEYEFPEYQNIRIAPKKFLFPQSEVLFSYEIEGNNIKIAEKGAEINNQIIFGIRNCDARSFKILDTFFSSGKYSDPYYFNKRNHTLLIGIACNEPMTTCFCTSVNGGPYSVEGFDAVLYELPEKYLFQIISPNGEKFKPYVESYSNASLEDLKLKDQNASHAREQIRVSLNLDNIEMELEGLYNHEIWQKIARTCLKCGACSYICPTCHCFDVQEKIEKTDIVGKSIGKRVRIWDTCQIPLFTLEASGHNPRAAGEKRTRQRIYHKFNYYLKNYDILGCVGCGRCIQVCPVNQDIRKTLVKVQEIAKNVQEGD
ncbi:MAG: 4Fe-4S dicluster domain-containing protein [Candidatus Lokiarchaeota archaeon]|nr:4Fe-4S dicluster domain-containing protein [Candidatus Harpocratesius repetitus]